jgi:DNA-binding SARP family transcriptional activator/TolB-like protein
MTHPERNAPAVVELRILGPTELRGLRSSADEASLSAPKRLALLGYLALESVVGFRRRDQIVALFWPDLPADGARAQLRKVLAVFRESLGPEAVVTRGEGEVRLDNGRVWCDAVALGEYLRNGRAPEALALYRGELLEGLFPEGVAQEFQDWLTDRRRQARQQAAAAAWECARFEEERDDRKAAAVMARRALDLTPDDEDGVRRLMSILDRHGDRGGALLLYTEWQARLQSEYGVEPAPETRRLARKIQAVRKGESHETPHVPPSPVASASAARLTLATTDSSDRALDADSSGERARRPHWSRGLAISATIGIAVLALGMFSIMRMTTSGRGTRPSSVAVRRLAAIGNTETAAAAVTEELTTALALAGLAVHPPRLAGGAEARRESDEAESRLRVDYVVDGGVQRAPSQLRVTLRLVRTNDGVAVWAGFYDVADTNVATMARAVAAAAVNLIRANVADSDLVSARRR